MSLHYPELDLVPMVDLNPPRDFCPVCCNVRPTGSRHYCSRQCSVKAYNFKKRISPLIAFLKSNGFKIVITNGIYYHITLPDYIAIEYPLGMDTIQFPDACQMIDKLNIEDLFSALRDHLGLLVVGTIRWLYDVRGGDFPYKFDEWISFGINAAMNDNAHSFLCSVCYHRYPLSGKAMTDNYLCHGCAISTDPDDIPDMPF